MRLGPTSAALLVVLAARLARVGDRDAATEEMDRSLAAILKGARMTSALRPDRQRPVDRLLVAIRERGLAKSGLLGGKAHLAKGAAEVRALSGRIAPGDQLVLAAGVWRDASCPFEGHGEEARPILVA